ncbi:hypothetical protein QO010_003364 [Caulobacter ginsengisoli]|uniref:Ankyrin n=1 Tax=Caulobacter ginsengisoli TaxID=400775 RepID=A0ABU0IU91_9CAUL|nr:hypothetical protein [Caulobacter ginsengisoli]MDQ0465575.1 hypothetical protein [Caulobacter ginsengisoli]
MRSDEISDRQAVLIRERLALYRLCANPTQKRLPIDKVIDNILAFQRKALNSDEAVEDSFQARNWMSPSQLVVDPIDPEDLRELLAFQRRRALTKHLPSFRAFLVSLPLANEAEFSSLESRARRNEATAQADTRIESRARNLIASVEGEYLSPEAITQKNKGVHALIYQSGLGGQVHIEIRHLAVTGPVDMVQCSKIDYGRVLPFSDGTASAAFPGKSLAYTARVNSEAGPATSLEVSLADVVLCKRLGISENLPSNFAYAIMNTTYSHRSILLGYELLVAPRYGGGLEVFVNDDLNDADSGGRGNTELIGATKAEDLKAMIDAIMAGANPNAREPESLMSPIHWAAHTGSRKASYLLRYGGYPNFDEETAEVEGIIDAYSDPEAVRSALAECALRLDRLALDAGGAYASAHVKCFEATTDAGRIAFLHYRELVNDEYGAAQRRGLPYDMQAPRGSPFSNIEVDPAWGDQPTIL